MLKKRFVINHEFAFLDESNDKIRVYTPHQLASIYKHTSERSKNLGLEHTLRAFVKLDNKSILIDTPIFGYLINFRNTPEVKIIYVKYFIISFLRSAIINNCVILTTR